MSDRMTVVERRMDAPIDHVFDVLTDAWLIPVWVVGATHMRDVDGHWPAPGAKMYHQVGAWPFGINDSTTVVECVRPTRLVLQAAAWPAGEARIAFDLSPLGAATTVTMAERPDRGPGRWIDNPLQRKLLRARNVETLQRLASIVEHRAS
ncbi:MAG: SRPBCC family protein [Jatrophihabitans sp.]|uniref:SRPBCC family protein n=1 Tax=Jatrophihabitans sp. TaxID=1932789 RepID=UPI003F820CE2